MKQVFYVTNKNGKPQIARNHALKELMQSFGDMPYQISIEKRVKKRSNPQNSYYHSCCIPAVMEGLVGNGYPRHELTHEIVHDYLKGKFLHTDVVSEQTGEVITRIKSTTELSTTDFMLFIDQIQQWAQEFLGICIPSPSEQSTIRF